MIVTWGQFLQHCEKNMLEARPHGRADKPGEYYPKKLQAQDAEALKLIEEGNRGYFERMCKAEGLDPKTEKISPALRAILREQARRMDEETTT